VALIADSVAAARAGTNPSVIARLPSGWAVIGDVQFLPGYCLLLGDPVVPSLNDLSCQARAQFLEDMVRIGDAILKSTDSFRINYEILGNAEPGSMTGRTPCASPSRNMATSSGPSAPGWRPSPDTSPGRWTDWRST
jgi:hypothetical protein